MDSHVCFDVLINKPSLLLALSNMLDTPVTDATYESETLQGGTVGEVVRIKGSAAAREGALPFSLILKTQRQWERYGDPACWRREHDIYKNHILDKMSPHIQLPRAYLLEEASGLTRIWMEDIEGATGSDQLHAGELALTARRLGRFQAEFHLHGRRDIPCLRPFPAVRSSIDCWWNRMSGPLSAEIEGFPEELRHVLNGYAERAEALLQSFDALPATLCQGDVHHDNIILREDAEGLGVYIIDWDCAGYGFMGEDAVDMLMEAFVYSDRDVALLPEYRRRIIGAYREGVSEGGVPFDMSGALVRDICALAWGFRVVDLILDYYRNNDFAKRRHVDILRAMLGGGIHE